MRLLVPLLAVCTLAAQDRGLAPVVIRDQATQAEVVAYSSSHALVIGCSAYRNINPLPGVPGDVVAVKAALEGQGFRVRTVMDPDGPALEKAVKSFVSQEGQDPTGRLVVYYAGHGATLPDAEGTEQGYLVPVDAPDTQDQGRFQDACMYMKDFLNRAQQAKARHVLFAFDSCFSGSLFATRAAPSAHVLTMAKSPVRLFMTSGSANEPVPDASVFRRAFVDGLGGAADRNGDGYVLGQELFGYLQERVINAAQAANGVQTPQVKALPLGREAVGDIVFVGSGGAAASSPTSAPVAPRPVVAAPALVPTGVGPLLAYAQSLTADASLNERIAAWEAVAAAVPPDEADQRASDRAAFAAVGKALLDLVPERQALERTKTLATARRLDQDSQATAGQRRRAWQAVVAAWSEEGSAWSAADEGQVAAIITAARAAGADADILEANRARLSAARQAAAETAFLTTTWPTLVQSIQPGGWITAAHRTALESAAAPWRHRPEVAERLAGLITRPAWATDAGADAAGRWVACTVVGQPLRFRLIPAGSYRRGSMASEAGRDDDETLHPVVISRPFLLADTEATVGLWRGVMGTLPEGVVLTGRDQHPITRVAWIDLPAFLDRLNSGVPGLRAGLPTEAQWEYAARAGRRDPWEGADLDAAAWYLDTAGGRTHTVATRAANAWGLYDTLGNVWEWCADGYGPYPQDEVTDPLATAPGDKVYRGGSWTQPAAHARPAVRGYDQPAVRGDDVGFRLCVTAW